MKVLYFSCGLPLDYTLQLANNVSEVYDVAIVIYQFNNKLENIEVNDNVNLITTKQINRPLVHPYNIFILYDLFKNIHSFKANIIHVQGGDILSLLMSIFLLKSAKLVTTLHDIELHLGNDTFSQKVVRFYFKQFSKIVFVHGKTLKELAKNDIEENKIHVITMPDHNTAPFEKYLDNTKDKKNTILFFGWISYNKGLEYLIKASKMIKEEIPDLKVIIAGRVGNGKYDLENFEKCKKLMENNDYFELHPHYISWSEASKFFHQSKCVVLPYIETSQSGVIPVAYKFKIPVIATRVGALPEIVEDKKTGLIVPTKDPEALGKAILKILKNEKMRSEMGKNGYKKLESDMSMNRICKETIKAYRNL